jgi:putative tryptophan/tyrosine transport system substrate-binding protein
MTRRLNALLIALALGLFIGPLSAATPPPGKVWQVGYLSPTPPPPYRGAIITLEAIRQGLRELGYVEGHNLALELRWADNHLDRLPALAAELVQRQVDVIVTIGSPPPVRRSR